MRITNFRIFMLKNRKYNIFAKWQKSILFNVSFFTERLIFIEINTLLIFRFKSSEESRMSILDCWIKIKVPLLMNSFFHRIIQELIITKYTHSIHEMDSFFVAENGQNLLFIFYTFSANVNIFRWSNPPNWASTFKYSSSRAFYHKKFNL